jgi:sugar transferase (PEP-CTERM/EpsH1 system associated)
MKILFLCHRLPYPPNRGGKIRPFNMIRHLGGNHTVTVASLAESQQEMRDGMGLRGYCSEVVAEVVQKPVRWLRAWKALFSSSPSSVAYFWSPELRRRIQATLLKTRFDTIFVHCAFMAQYVLDAMAPIRILDFGDLDSAKWTDYSRSKSFPFTVGYKLEATKMRRYEKHVAGHFDQCTVTTRGELEEFEKLDLGVPCSIIPNGVDAHYFRSNSTRRDPRIIVFVGRMDYFPNIDGVLYFTKHIFPIVRRSVPDAQLRIVGSNPNRAVRNLATVPGITVTGHVPDVRSYLEDAIVAVAPLRLARGTQNKILEAMAMSMPVVATSAAAKGIDAVPGRHLLVGDDPGEFATKVVELLKSPDLRAQLSIAGCRQVQYAHAWPNSLDILDGILKKAKDERENHQARLVHHIDGTGSCFLP